MWLAGRSVAPLKLVVLKWQVEHTPALTMLCTIEGGAVPLLLVNEKLLKLDEEWQPSQAIVPVGMCVAGSVTVLLGAVPTSVLPAPWQLTQPVVNPVWFIGGTALAITKVEKLVAE